MTKSPAGGPAERVIRDEAFALRLKQAADAHSQVPDMHFGRLAWIQRNLKSLHKVSVSTETVRKWFSGEAKPRPAKMTPLAQLLEVDEAWLSLGVDPNMTPRQRAVRDAMVSGVVNVVAGLIQMDGGIPAFPDADDEEAQQRGIDLHAIIRGGKFDIHVTLGEHEDGDTYKFSAPVKHESVIVLGVVRDGFSFRIFEVPPELVADGHKRGLSVDVTARLADLRPIESFKQRL